MATVNIYLTDDTHVYESKPDSNYDWHDPDNVLVTGNSGSERRAWFKFGDLSSIPGGATINSATIYIGCYQVGGTYSQEFELIRCEDNGWDESTITWNNAPDAYLAGSASGTFYNSSVGTVSFDVTSDMIAAIADGALSYRIHNSTLDGSQLWIYQEENHSGNVYIVVDYTVSTANGSFFF